MECLRMEYEMLSGVGRMFWMGMGFGKELYCMKFTLRKFSSVNGGVYSASDLKK